MNQFFYNIVAVNWALKHVLFFDWLTTKFSQCNLKEYKGQFAEYGKCAREIYQEN